MQEVNLHCKKYNKTIYELINNVNAKPLMGSKKYRVENINNTQWY